MNEDIKKVYDVIAERYDKLKSSNFKGLDPRIIETVKLYGSINNVIPVWSCSGHTLEEMQLRIDMARKSGKYQGPVRKNKYGKYTTYVIVVTTGSVNNLFSKFLEWSSLGNDTTRPFNAINFEYIINGNGFAIPKSMSSIDGSPRIKIGTRDYIPELNNGFDDLDHLKANIDNLNSLGNYLKDNYHG